MAILWADIQAGQAGIARARAKIALGRLSPGETASLWAPSQHARRWARFTCSGMMCHIL